MKTYVFNVPEVIHHEVRVRAESEAEAYERASMVFNLLMTRIPTHFPELRDGEEVFVGERPIMGEPELDEVLE